MYDLPEFDDLMEYQKIRINCPSCGGIKTFTATRTDGIVLYNCYKAGCNVSGKKRMLSSSRYIREKSIILPSQQKQKEFKIQDHFSVYLPKKMTRYCNENNINTDKVQLYHDVKLDRAVFPIFDVKINEGSLPTITPKIVDAVGRSLSKYGAKWHRYSNSGLPFICGEGETCYVVEDSASAVAVSQHGTGLALLGTNLSNEVLDIVIKYPYVIVCLDKDASSKAIRMKNRIAQFTRANVKLLEVDPKENPKGVLND